VIAVDTNILVYAHREDVAWFPQASAAIASVAEAGAPWAIPWPCVHEFLAIVTHPRIFAAPTPLEQAVDQVTAWLESPSLVLLGEGSRHWSRLSELVQSSRASGPLVHDARVAALCLANGVTELWSADRDFGRFPALKVRNPLVSR
jgi:toxin-antitoxin system PIN domain toxin